MGVAGFELCFKLNYDRMRNYTGYTSPSVNLRLLISRDGGKRDLSNRPKVHARRPVIKP
jgi:hypothetical protein